MRIDGRFTYLANHSMANLDNMYKWSQDKDLISIEAGSLSKIEKDKDHYGKYVMTSLIENNHEANSSYCHVITDANFPKITDEYFPLSVLKKCHGLFW